MSNVSTVAKFLKVSENKLLDRAAVKGEDLFPDTYLTAEQMVTIFGFEKAGLPEDDSALRTRTVLIRAAAFLATTGAAFFLGFCVSTTLPAWIRPKPSAMFFTMLGYLFWGLFTGVWGHLMLYRAVKRKLLRGQTEGLVLHTATEGRETGDHRALFVRVSVLYRALDKIFIGDWAVIGKTVRSFDDPLPQEIVRAGAAYPDGASTDVFFDPAAPARFALKRQIGLKLLGAVSGAAVIGVSVFFIALAGATARILSA